MAVKGFKTSGAAAPGVRRIGHWDELTLPFAGCDGRQRQREHRRFRPPCQQAGQRAGPGQAAEKAYQFALGAHPLVGQDAHRPAVAQKRRYL